MGLVLEFLFLLLCIFTKLFLPSILTATALVVLWLGARMVWKAVCA